MRKAEHQDQIVAAGPDALDAALPPMCSCERVEASSEKERDRLRQRLRIGVQWNTQVTIRGSSQTVAQACCSALCAAILNSQSTGNS